MRNLARILAVVGPLVTIQSIAWEYTRMRPDYRFLVEPWAIRGYELTQGSVVAAIGVALLLIGFVTMTEASRRTAVGLAAAALFVVSGVAIAIIFDPGTDVDISAGILIALAAIYGYGLMKLARRLLPDFSAISGLLGGLVVTLGATVIVFVVLNSIFGSSTLDPWLLTLLALSGVALVAAAGTPVELTANRVFIFATIVGGFVIARLGASLRAALISAQVEVGAAAQYKDTQTTNGWLLAVFGTIIAFIAAVSLWARRRDFIITQRRAAEQRAAAEKSAAEIAAAAASSQ